MLCRCTSTHGGGVLRITLRQAVGVARLAGGPSDAEMLGELVWAPGYQGMRWPGEMLDPFRLPPSRSLPVRALQGAPAPRMLKGTTRVFTPLHLGQA